MAPKGEDEGWFRNANGAKPQMKNTDSISVRISNRTQTVVDRDQHSPDAEDEVACCFPGGRLMGRTVLSDSSNTKRAPYARLGAEDPQSKNIAKVKEVSQSWSRPVGTDCCCFGRRGQPNCTTVEVRAVDGKSNNGITKQGAGANTEWEVDISEEYCKRPLWKQLIRKAKAHTHAPRQALHKSGCEWLNYDPHSYQMNFDDGCWRENCISSLYVDEKDDAATRERAMQSALLKKFNASRTQQGLESFMSTDLSPLPVKMMPKEELEKSKDGFVSNLQRRQGAPAINLDRRQRTGQQE